MFSRVASQVVKYFQGLHTGKAGEYLNCIGGEATLYASCFAVMTWQYLGILSSLGNRKKQAWGNYILDFQDANTGFFIGPEIVGKGLLSSSHSLQHVSEHLTAHVLPALSLLEVAPRYKLSFAENYLNHDYLEKWLASRCWLTMVSARKAKAGRRKLVPFAHRFL